EKVLGYPTAAFFGCSHSFGGYAGSHAEYIRVPYADKGCFKIPDELSYEQGLFASDAFPTAYMGAEMAVEPGDVVDVLRAGGVGQIAVVIAWLKKASRVFVIDKYDYRLSVAAENGNDETLNYEKTDIFEALKEATGGHGPDVCIDAVGMEANSTGIEDLYDNAK